MPNRPQFGITLVNIPIQQAVKIAVLAEELGFDSVWCGEHVVLPIGYSSSVPNYLPGGAAKSNYLDPSNKFYDLFALAGATAQATSRISIVTSIYLLAFRHPLAVARSVATVAELSEGRFQLGIGTGWNKEEFAALGVSWKDRGALVDESVEVLRMAMKGGPFEHHGHHYSFGQVQITEEPIDCKILVGGNSNRALRRAAMVGDGWLPSGELEVDEILGLRDQIDQMREDAQLATPFDHWIKVNPSERGQIDELQGRGVDKFLLQLWGLADQLPFAQRCERLAAVAERMGITPSG